MPEPPNPPEGERPLGPRLSAALRRHGSSAISFLAVESGMRHWFDAPGPEGTGACVAYVDTGSGWIAAGDPMAPASDVALAATRFVDAARAQGKRACFFASESLAAEGFARVLLGEQPIYRAAEWRTTVAERRRLREQLRRARAKGVRVRRVAPLELRRGEPLRAEVEGLVAEWLASRRMAPMRFLVALEPFHAPDEHRYFVAERDGRAVEFLSAVPIYARRGWLVEDVVRSAAAPNGTTESLLHALLDETADDEFVTLGIAPLTGRVSSWMRAVRFVARPLYSFAGLRAFRERLRPVAWQPVWLVFPRGDAATLHVLETLRAFAGGSLIGFATRSLLRNPSGPPFALALPLIPWTVFLGALVALHGEGLLGFSRAALAAWTVFDAVLALLLFRCAMRPRRRGLLLMTAAASFDALLSLSHFAATGPGPTLAHVAIRAISTGAPLFGAAALTWATVHANMKGSGKDRS